MLSLNIEQISGAISATVAAPGEARIFNSVCTDSRTVRQGDLFFALHGESFDGHHFAVKAAESGAKGMVLEKPVPGLPPHITVFLVENTKKALQDLAAYNRRVSGVMLIAVTGSSGKTSTKDLLYSVLSTKFRTLKTQGNFNNELGLPLTLLQLGEEHQVAVVEMGMRGLQEIDFLGQIAQPNGAVITNIGEAHYELLGSVDNIARAKGEILEHIPEQGFAVLHGDSPFIQREAQRCRGKVILYGENPGFDLYVREIAAEEGGHRFIVVFQDEVEEFFLPLLGRHNVINSLAAIAVGHELGMSYPEIRTGLEQANLTAMRLEVSELNGTKIINDAYNANPDSTRAAISVLLEMTGKRKIAVLGDMLELGDKTETAHRELGKAVFEAGVDRLVAVGELGRFIGAGAHDAGLSDGQIHYYQTASEAGIGLKNELQPGDVILVKGSRGMKMEGVIQALI